ncbi:MAG: NAD(P)/FAD-dependent oxidoreductase, partial [Oscillospiraceae bacterium]
MIQNARLEMYDVAVAGAGPAGLLAAAAAARRGFSVCVVEREEQFPRKLLITGKGRCNLTNACDSETFFDNVRCGAKFLRSAYSAFSADDIMRHIEALGVPLKIERGRRVFPQSERAADIADALVRDARAAGCSFVTARASGVRTESGAVAAFSLVGGGEIRCRSAIIATGGLSYPQTGSTGDGLRIANALGHS